MLPVKISELELAYDFVSSVEVFTHSAYISRKTGKIFWESDFTDEIEEHPEDLGDPEHYIAVPHKNELDLGKRLVMRFVASQLPQEYDNVEDTFRHKGAYSRFKAMLESKGVLDTWYEFEENETKAALKQWCEEEGIELIEG